MRRVARRDEGIQHIKAQPQHHIITSGGITKLQHLHDLVTYQYQVCNRNNRNIELCTEYQGPKGSSNN